MKSLEEKILKEGKCIGSEILKVDMFLNHQIDTKFMDEMGEEIARLFKDEKPNKILTIEASGIAIAMAASRALGYIPVVFAKKSKPSTMVDGNYMADAKSFTKGTVNTLVVAKDFLNVEDRVLLVDDFLASGEAGLAMMDLVKQAGGKVVGFTAAIEKKHQGGGDRLRKEGIKVSNLAVIEKMQDGKIEFEQEDK